MGWQDDAVVGEASPEASPEAAAPQVATPKNPDPQATAAKPAWEADPVVGEADPADKQSPSKEPSDVETAKASLGEMVKPAKGTTPGTWEHARGMGREAFLEANPLVNLGAWAIKQATGQKTKGTLELGPALKEPEPTFTESMKAAGEMIAKRPLTSMAELAKGLVYSPELAVLSMSRGPEAVARIAGLAKAGKAARSAAMMGTSMAEGGAAMGAVSALQQSVQKDKVNAAETGAAAAMGAVAIPAMKVAGKLLFGAKAKTELPPMGEVKGGTTPTLDRFTETVTPEGEVKAPEGKPMEFEKVKVEPGLVEHTAKEQGLDYSGFKAEWESKPLVEKAKEHILSQDAQRTKVAQENSAWESFKKEQAKEAKADEYADKYGELGDRLSEKRGAGKTQSRPDWKQRGEADPKVLAMIGLTAAGAAGGAYLAGDEKIAGAVLGGVAAAGAMRLPSTIAALGKTLSYSTAAGNAARIGAVMGVGAYLGDKSGNPIEGAAIAASVLLGRGALRPSVKLSTDDMIRARNGNVAAQERITLNLKRDIGTAIPEEARRVAVSEAIDRGDMEGLSADERKVYSAVKNFNEQMGKEAVDAEVIKGMRTNYISYIVERDPAMTEAQQSGIIKGLFDTGAFSENASPNTKFGKHGKYESFSDINNALKGSGLKLKTQDVGEITAIYGKAMRAAIENKLLIDGLKSAKGPSGEQYLQPRDKNGNLPQGYKTMQHPQLQSYGIHPDLYDSMKVVFDSSDPNIVTRGMLGLSMATKRVQVFGSLFHAKSLAEVYGNAMGKDAYLRGKAPIDDALRMFREGGLGDTLDMGLRNGLQMKVPEDVSQTVIGDIGKKLDGFLPMKAGTAVSDKIDFVNGKLDKITWDYMHAGIKGALFTKEFETLTARNAELHAKDPAKNPLKSQDQIAKEVAKYTNDLAGGLDWFTIAADTKTQLGRNLGMFFASPQGRRFAQIIAFAPDWGVSTLRAGFNAFGQSDSGLKGLWKPENATDLYRRYALRSTAYWLTALNGINMATSGHPIWENKDPTRIEFEDGTSMQAGKHTFEAVHAVADPAKFAYNKMGFTPKMVADFFSGKEGYGASAPKYDSFAQHAAKTALPFTVSAASQQGLEPGERVKRAVWSGGGFPKYGTTPEQKKAARDDRTEKKRLKKRKLEGYDE